MKYSLEFINNFLKCFSKYTSFCSDHSIIPNENGNFCKIDDLYVDDNIPEIFKECLHNCFGIDINEELINNGITNIKPKSSKTIYNYKNIINKYFRMRETKLKKKKSEYLPLEKKKEAAEYLIRIIPKKDENNSDNDLHNKQTKLFEIYKFFTGNNCESYEIEQNNDDNIWNYSNQYIYLIIKEIIEEEYNLDSLSFKLEKSKESIIENLKQYIKFSSSGKIVLNQNNTLCEKDELFNEKEWKDSETLKNISINLGYDVKEKLAHKSMEIPCLTTMTYDEICSKIDQLMYEKFQDKTNYQDCNYKKASKILLDYFDDIGKEAKQYFYLTFPIREKIAYNVIYDEKTRKNIAKIEKSININKLSSLLKNTKIKKFINKIINDEETCQCLHEIEEKYDRESLSILIKNSKETNNYFELEKILGKNTISTLLNKTSSKKNLIDLINNEEIYNNFCKYDINDFNKLFNHPNILKSIINGELSDTNYKSDNKNLNWSSYCKPLEISKGTNIITLNNEIVKSENTINFFRIALKPMIKFGDDFDFTSSINSNNPINRRTEITGEAYIYELFKNSGKFKKVKWNILSETGNGEIFEYKVKNYKINLDLDNLHYDILVEEYDGSKIYIKVKSTKYKLEDNNKIPFFISHKQIETMENIEYPNKYILAIVFDVMSNPNHFFITLRKYI